jgi:uncharacterized protein YkwD
MAASGSVMSQARWEELARTAAVVRAGVAPPCASRRSWRRAATTAVYFVVLTGVTIAALHAVANSTPVRADGTADADLFSLTNQDRTSNGVRSLNGNATLGGIGEGSRYNGCGFAVNGRSVDMIQRNYFSHLILNCGGQYVFSMMQAFGVRYSSAGENIGWNTYGDAGTAASQINSAFMNSPDHRANILNGNYTDLGIGSANSGAAAFTGGGGSYTGAWMFSEEFAQLSSSRPPPPPPPPRPRPSGGGTPTRNTAPPPPPGQAPVAVVVATPIPTPTVPAPTPLPTLTIPPLLGEQGGLLFNAVESVLESYLID